jgi:hypothetical protein
MVGQVDTCRMCVYFNVILWYRFLNCNQDTECVLYTFGDRYLGKTSFPLHQNLIIEMGMVGRICNLTTSDAKAGRWRVQGGPEL